MAVGKYKGKALKSQENLDFFQVFLIYYHLIDSKKILSKTGKAAINTVNPTFHLKSDFLLFSA